MLPHNLGREGIPTQRVPDTQIYAHIQIQTYRQKERQSKTDIHKFKDIHRRTKATHMQKLTHTLMKKYRKVHIDKITHKDIDTWKN